jgi:hypothetical protein
MPMTLILEPAAIADILRSALEGYLVPTEKHKYTEVFGLCFGHVRAPTRVGSHPIVTVKRCPAQLRAKMSRRFVVPNELSEEVHVAIDQLLTPGIELVGDFHTHPSRSNRAMLAGQGAWWFSPGDEQFNITWTKRIRRRGHRPLVGIIAGVGAITKSPAPPAGSLGPHTAQFAALGCHIVVAAYRILEDGRYSRDVALSAPAG